MASKLYRHLWTSEPLIKKSSVIKNHLTFRNIHTNNVVPVKEIQIRTHWGHIAAKLWGNENQRPILALHGWQDNAGTWDPLAPILAKGCSILAVDLPGHGLSSWIPPGMQYYPWEFPRLILFLKDHFKWDKVTLLAHSMGSIASLRFASLFPNEVDAYIAFDSLVADDYDLNFVVDKYENNIKKLLLEQTRFGQEPPSYSLEDIKQKWHLGTHKSVSLASTEHLCKRGIKPSKHNADKFYFSRDSRLKYVLFHPEDKKVVEALALKLKCPTLFIKAIDSPYSSDKYTVEMRELIANNNSLFENYFVPGTHHVHLNDPELVAPLVIKFLKKHNLFQENTAASAKN